MRVKTGADFLETKETLDEQSGADEQHQRERHFTDQQETARARAAGTVARPAPFLK